MRRLLHWTFAALILLQSSGASIAQETDQPEIEARAKEMSEQLQTAIRESESSRQGVERFNEVLKDATNAELAAIAYGDAPGAAVIAYQYYLMHLPYLEDFRPTPPDDGRRRSLFDSFLGGSDEAAGRRKALTRFVNTKLPCQLSDAWLERAMNNERSWFQCAVEAREWKANDDESLRDWFVQSLPKYGGVRFYTQDLLNLGLDPVGRAPIESVDVEFSEQGVQFSTSDHAAVTITKEMWSSENEDEISDIETTYSVDYCCAVASDRFLFLVFHDVVGGRATCLAFDASGELAWNSTCWACGSDNTAGSGPSMNLIHNTALINGVVYVAGVGTGGSYIDGFNVETGEPVFRFASNWWNCDRWTQ